MSTCHNCGHTGTFVLLVQFALAVPGDPPADETTARDCDAREDALLADLSRRGDCSLAVQCPACDSTDVDARAADLLAPHESSTTS